MWVVRNIQKNETFNSMSYVSALSETSVTVQTFFNLPKITAATRK